jgi:hypothetical protein
MNLERGCHNIRMENILILYPITGDAEYEEMGCKMFESVERRPTLVPTMVIPRHCWSFSRQARQATAQKRQRVE